MDASKGKGSALITAALALPGLSPASPEQGYRSEDVAVSYHRGRYVESDDRMEVDVDQLSVTGPIGERFEGRLNLIRDVMSGASPVINGRRLSGKPFQVLQSGASIRDERVAIDATLGWYGDDSYLAVRAGRSREDDYESDFASLEYRRDFNQRNTTLTLSAAYEDDRLWESTDIPEPIADTPIHERTKRDFLVGVSQLLDRNSLVQANLTYSRSSGFLSDPYKKVYVASRDPLRVVPLLSPVLDGEGPLGNLLPLLPVNLAVETPLIRLIGLYDDSRPDRRDQWIAVLRYSRYLEGSDSALHLDYRLGLDDWGADSHTLDLQWNKTLGSGWSFGGGLRYYTQHAADFYAVNFDRLPRDRIMSSDYRLAGFGAVSARVGLAKTFADERWTLRLDYERYERRKDLELTDSAGDALDDYSADLLGLTLEGRF